MTRYPGPFDNLLWSILANTCKPDGLGSNEGLLVAYQSETRNPATVSFATALSENAGGVLFGEFDVQVE